MGNLACSPCCIMQAAAVACLAVHAALLLIMLLSHAAAAVAAPPPLPCSSPLPPRHLCRSQDNNDYWQVAPLFAEQRPQTVKVAAGGEVAGASTAAGAASDAAAAADTFVGSEEVAGSGRKGRTVRKKGKNGFEAALGKLAG